MLELAAVGAKVLHLRCVEYARRFDVPIHVRSSFSQREGTMVLSPEAIEAAEAVIEITQFGSTRSINASAAAAVTMHSWVMQHVTF
jgi:aspartokinase